MTIPLRFLLFILTCINWRASAQDFTVKSLQVPMPGKYSGMTIREMSDGSTVVFFDKYKATEIFVRIYKPDHSLALEKKLDMDSIAGFDHWQVVGTCEAGRRACLFYMATNQRKKYEQLYRLEIDPSNGNCYNEPLLRAAEPAHFAKHQVKVTCNTSYDAYTITAITEKDKGGSEFTALTYSQGQKLVDKYTRAFPDAYQLYLVDAMKQKDELYFCIDFKLHPKESEKDAFGDAKYIYLPENKVYVIRHRLNDGLKEELLLPLKESYYIVKGQFTFDPKHREVNLLFSGIDPMDSYRRVASVHNVFYKFSSSMFQLLSEREITNTLAIERAGTLKDLSSTSPVEPNKKNFMSCPQYISTDSAGKSCLVMQTVYNFYHGKEANASADLRTEDIAVYQLSREGEIEKIDFFPYRDQYGVGFSMGIDEFCFNPGNEGYFYNREPVGLTVLNTGKNHALIYNPIFQNIGKKFGDELSFPNHTYPREPMLVLARPNVSSTQHLLPDTEEFKKLNLYSKSGSFNPVTNTFTSVALDPGSSKRWLVWVQFER